MKEFVLIKRSRYEQLMKLESSQTLVKNLELPPEIENNLENRRILDERNVTRNVQSGKITTEESVQVNFPPVKMEQSSTDMDHEHRSKNEVKPSRIIPIYVNTIPKEHREKATKIVEDLVNRKVIHIDSDGYITKPGGRDMMSFEEFLRAIMIKNAALGTNAMLLREIASEINPDNIRNAKVLGLIGRGNPKLSWIR